MRIFGRESVESTRATSSKTPVSCALAVSSTRIGEIVGAAETAVADIQAEADVLRHLEGSAESKISRDRLVAELADSLVARAEELKRDAANLADVLERASKRLDASAPTASPSPAPTKTESAKRGSSAAGNKRRGAPANLQDKVADRFVDSGPSPAKGRLSAFKRRPSASRTSALPSSPSPEGLRLLATQMVVGGSGRDEIEDLLRKDFGVKDASAVLGDIGTGNIENGGRAGE